MNWLVAVRRILRDRFHEIPFSIKDALSVLEEKGICGRHLQLSVGLNSSYFSIPRARMKMYAEARY